MVKICLFQNTTDKIQKSVGSGNLVVFVVAFYSDDLSYNSASLYFSLSDKVCFIILKSLSRIYHFGVRLCYMFFHLS